MLRKGISRHCLKFNVTYIRKLSLNTLSQYKVTLNIQEGAISLENLKYHNSNNLIAKL